MFLNKMFLTDHLHINGLAARIRASQYLHEPGITPTIHVIGHEVIARHYVERMSAFLDPDDLFFREGGADVVVLFANF